jgi:phosphatidylserine/phosphatidylglycerophosphate/cardiolipin synthase-like enzyme
MVTRRLSSSTQTTLRRYGLAPATAPYASWLAHGDAPGRVVETLVPLVDGRAAMLAMCAAFLSAKESIWLADWDIHVRLKMVRGKDWQAGEPGSPEQTALEGRLRAAGLDDEALDLWRSGDLRVVDVLGFAAARGVDVRVLLWSPYDPFGRVHIVNDLHDQRLLLEARGVACRPDKHSRSIFHLAQALHQKCAVVDGTLAFVGGVDLTVEYDGDYDRWDVPAHPYDGRQRGTEIGPASHPWHDAHLMLAGSPARDVERNIRQRWDEAGSGPWQLVTPPVRSLAWRVLTGEIRAERRGLVYENPPGERPDSNELLEGAQARVQVVRTIPAFTYRFAPEGIHGISDAYRAAFQRAEQFIYLESQYFWLEGYNGVNMWRLGWQSRYMVALFNDLAAAAERGVTVALVLPDHPNAGRQYTDATIAWFRERAPKAQAAGRLHFFTLAASNGVTGGAPARYRPVYVHAKTAVVDDRWATIGSANLNSRGMSHDAEINVSVLDNEFARSLRLSLWTEHLGWLCGAHTGWPEPCALPLRRPLQVPEPPASGILALVRAIEAHHVAPDGADTEAAHPDPAELAALADPCAGIRLLAERAGRNLERLLRGEPLVGQLLPYLRAGEGDPLGLAVDPRQGYLDPLAGPLDEAKHGRRAREAM